MNKDGIAGSTQQAVGAVKQAPGKTIGDPTLFIDDIAEKTDGKIENASGDPSDTNTIDLANNTRT